MGTKIRLEMDGFHQIMAKRKADPGGLAHKTLLSELRAKSDPYVPFDKGPLKNSSYIVPEKGQLIYPSVYARYQYYGKVMVGRAPKQVTNKDLKYQGGPKRGSHWATRAWADRGPGILKAVAAVIGGKVG